MMMALFLLLGAILMAMMAMHVLANSAHTAARVIVPGQRVNVDGDEQDEYFGASFRVFSDGTIAGSATIRDEEGTNVYGFSSAKVACDIGGFPYLLLDVEALSLENGGLFAGSTAFQTVLSSNGHSGTLIWANNWQTAANGFQLHGQMSFPEDACSESLMDWFLVF